MRIVVALLIVALSVSVALGLLGLWPNLRNDSTGDRRQRTELASTIQEYVGDRGGSAVVTRIRLDYLPGLALVELKASGSPSACATVSEDYGQVFDRSDFKLTACDF